MYYLMYLHLQTKTLAGVVRFELTHVGVRVRCLTAWRYPNIFHIIILSLYFFFVEVLTRKVKIKIFTLALTIN